MLSWIQGERVPRSVASFEILARIERRYRLPAGYFKAKLPYQTRSLLGESGGAKVGHGSGGIMLLRAE